MKNNKRKQQQQILTYIEKAEKLVTKTNATLQRMANDAGIRLPSTLELHLEELIPECGDCKDRDCENCWVDAYRLTVSDPHYEG